MCPQCNVKLIPIVYGKLTPELVDLDKAGKIIVVSGKYKKGKPTSYCIGCEEVYHSIVTID